MATREDATGDEERCRAAFTAATTSTTLPRGGVLTFSHANVLQRDMYPSATKFEAEIIAMVLDLLNGDANACGWSPAAVPSR